MATGEPSFSPSLTLVLPVVTKTAAYSVTDADYTILANAAGGAFDVTLPTAVGRTGKTFFVKRTSATNTVTVKATAGTLDGTAAATGIALDAQYKGRWFTSDGTNWHITGAIG